MMLHTCRRVRGVHWRVSERVSARGQCQHIYSSVSERVSERVSEEPLPIGIVGAGLGGCVSVHSV
jgi:hypothetical protein